MYKALNYLNNKYRGVDQYTELSTDSNIDVIAEAELQFLL